MKALLNSGEADIFVEPCAPPRELGRSFGGYGTGVAHNRAERLSAGILAFGRVPDFNSRKLKELLGDYQGCLAAHLPSDPNGLSGIGTPQGYGQLDFVSIFFGQLSQEIGDAPRIVFRNVRRGCPDAKDRRVADQLPTGAVEYQTSYRRDRHGPGAVGFRLTYELGRLGYLKLP